jgi:hypothetical protein
VKRFCAKFLWKDMAFPQVAVTSQTAQKSKLVDVVEGVLGHTFNNQKLAREVVSSFILYRCIILTTPIV